MTIVAKSRERFIRETATHEMTVLRDDGLYRHLRFQRPDTSMYWFDLVTWPGVLTISGDCGCFVFSRTRDMFEFFGDGGSSGGFDDDRYGINPHYWSEKLRAPRQEAARKYDFEVYEARVREWLADALEQLDDDEHDALRAAVQEQLLDDELGEAYHSEAEAHRRLRDFEHNGRRLGDTWEWDLREYDWSFLWCCWAIVWGIEQYRAASRLPVEAAA